MAAAGTRQVARPELTPELCPTGEVGELRVKLHNQSKASVRVDLGFGPEQLNLSYLNHDSLADVNARDFWKRPTANR